MGAGANPVKLLFVGDFNITRGTGYATILSNVCTHLAERHQVTVLGEKWDRSEHHFPFQVIPTDYRWIPVQVLRLCQAMKFDHIILAMDIPKIHQVLNEVRAQQFNWNTLVSGLFPVESDPLIDVWSEALGWLYRRFVISEFGQRELKAVDLDSVFVPMTALPPKRKIEPLEARRQLNCPECDLVLLTVADNQERKDLPVIADTVAWLGRRDIQATWLLVTTPRSGYGWNLPDLLNRAGVTEQTMVMGGLSTEELGCAYQAADAFILASQAEGACLPLYEAMVHGLVCVAPNHTAITEALTDGRGLLVEPGAVTIHPWGNVRRYHTSPQALGLGLLDVMASPSRNGAMADFIESRPWSLAAERIEEGLND